MSLSVLVVNQPPDTDNNVPQPLLELFQEYTRTLNGQTYSPFQHQAEVFRRVMADQEVFLVAGTAAGKTLAIAVPLFEKLRTGRIRKVLLMYPTIALMEDQRRVMDTLAEITGLEIGQLRGGMSRAELMTALNKPVILATPDEVYWFFHKNVKYSSLLIYGLALVDEFVLDEAHLFHGLMLRNLVHLKRRVQLLAAKLGQHPRWHVLTATPTPELRILAGGPEVCGRSKCGDVEVTFLDPVKGHEERQNRLVDAVESALAAGAQKVLLVFNSADLAHRVFEGKGRSQPDLPPDLQWRFGRIRWGQFKAWLEKKGIASEDVEEIERWLKREGPFHLKDLDARSQVLLPAENLAAKVARLLEGQVWGIKRLVYSVTSEGAEDPVKAVERRLGRQKLAQLLWCAAVSAVKERSDPKSLIEGLEGVMSQIQSGVERVWAEDSLCVTAPEFAEIIDSDSLQKAGASREMAEAIIAHLKHTVELPEQAAAELRTSPQELAQRRLALSWLDWLIKDQTQRQELVARVRQALAEKELEVETRHIASWGDTGVPVVIYTGKMTRAERQGLIEAFAGLPRAVLISTPAVEVGVDFAADVLITEQCDGNSFLQRFGRVGRRPGIQGKVMILVKDGETYFRLFQCYQSQMSREEFSTLIADPGNGIFPARPHAEGSAFLDATHWLINAQLGEIGDWLNEKMFGKETAALARQLQSAGLPFAYGLRGTLPEVALRGGGGGEPFYILRKVPNEQLLPTDSPFEMARAGMGYIEFLWKRAAWKAIVVDVQATLEASQALFWWQDGQWRMQTGYGIAADYLRLFSDQPVSQGKSLPQLLNALKPRITEDLDGFLSELNTQKEKPLPRLLLRIGKALGLFWEPHARFILGQGDVYLLRVDQDGIAEPVEDCLGNPLVLPDQTWLLLYGYSKEKAQELLEAASALDWQEVIYDWQTLEVQGGRIIGPVLLDRVAGACFDVYRRLAKYVGR